ncbi:MAG: hypothetical protein K1X82_13960, partial [Bacteroidia bacterium]|nr:hypothetical protein [Bacteroidia bacterium]
MDIQKGIFPSTFLFFLGLFSLSLLLHFPFLNKDLIGVHVWRQTQTQTGIDNFCREGNSILNPTLNSNPETDRIVRLEFPLMQWGFAQVEKHFSNPVLITRL